MNWNKLNKYLHNKSIPNAITSFRIILIIPIIIFLEINFKSIAWFLILIGGISDFLDGFIASKYNSKTKLGAIIDPLADKILILIPFTWLSINQIIPFWSFSLIIIREFIITSIRNQKGNGMPAIHIAKYKSLFQLISLLFIINPLNNIYILNLGLIFYWISFVLCISSSFFYLRIK